MARTTAIQPDGITPQEFADFLKFMRNSLSTDSEKMTQGRFCKALGIPKTTYVTWEVGAVIPANRTVIESKVREFVTTQLRTRRLAS